MTVGAAVPAGAWTRAERIRLSAVLAVVVALHVCGWTSYLYYAHDLVGASSFAGAGTLAYVLGVRHAFDADHIAAIDDTTRLMMQRGRRPIGVGFFFAMGHSTVVVVLALVVALASGAATTARVDAFRHVGSVLSTLVATGFLLLVAVLNSVVLVEMTGLWRRLRGGTLEPGELDVALLNRGLMNRVLGGRARAFIRSSWQMFPVGMLFGLGLETASEVTLLALSASSADSGGVPVLAILTLPILFAAGMSACDTGDSLLMVRAYSWSQRRDARRLYYNLVTTGITVAVAGFVASVYLAKLLAAYAGWRFLAPYAAIAGAFELLGYAIVAVFVLSWLLATAVWRLGAFDRRYPAGVA